MPAPLVVRRAVAVAGLVAAGLLTGCTETVEPPIGQAPAPAPAERVELVAGLAALYAGPGADADADQQVVADCFARRLLDLTSVDQLADAGLVVDGAVVERAPTLPEPLARRWFAAQQACADFVDASTRAQVAATKGRLDAEGYAACLRRSLPPARIEAAVVATLTASWDDPAVAELTAAQADCAAAALPRD